MCMALNLYHEARSEPVEGIIAVGNVVMNRVKSDKYPNDVCSVIKQGYESNRKNCQFSWYCDGSSDEPKNKKMWSVSVALADQIVRGKVVDFSRGATHYHATSVSPKWAKNLKKTTEIGYHVFYK